MSKRNRKKNWNLYVLRYNYSGNYYVGTTPNFIKRMEIHRRRRSTKHNLPECSADNYSTKGFRFYWFLIEKRGVKQGVAEKCEYCLANELEAELRNLNPNVHVWNGTRYAEYKKSKGNAITENKDNLMNIDHAINEFLKNRQSLNPSETPKNLSIKCYKMGCIEEYDETQCNKSFDDVAKYEYPKPHQVLGKHKK